MRVRILRDVGFASQDRPGTIDVLPAGTVVDTVEDDDLTRREADGLTRIEKAWHLSDPNVRVWAVMWDDRVRFVRAGRDASSIRDPGTGTSARPVR